MSLPIIKVAGELVDKLLGRVDDLVTSKEEKAVLKNDYEKIVNEGMYHVHKHVTARHKTDMTSDSWLSKNIRPLTLVFILVAYSIFSIADGNLVIRGNQFNINPDYITLLGEWGKAIMYFYFGGRTIEKAIKIFNKTKSS